MYGSFPNDICSYHIYSMETLQTLLSQSYFVSAAAQPSEYDTADSAKELTIALVTDALFSDAGWGAFGYNAAQVLNSKYGHEVDFKDDVPIPEIETTLRDYAAEGYDMIIAQGFEWGDPAVKVGKGLSKYQVCGLYRTCKLY
jgi:basic membrane protein A and related proteins